MLSPGTAGHGEGHSGPGGRRRTTTSRVLYPEGPGRPESLPRYQVAYWPRRHSRAHSATRTVLPACASSVCPRWQRWPRGRRVCFHGGGGRNARRMSTPKGVAAPAASCASGRPHLCEPAAWPGRDRGRPPGREKKCAPRTGIASNQPTDRPCPNSTSRTFGKDVGDPSGTPRMWSLRS